LFSNWWKQCSFSDNPNAQKWRLRRACLKVHRKKMVGRRQGFCLQNKNNILFYHHTCKNGRPRKINMYMVNTFFRTKTNILEELKMYIDYFHFHAQHQQLLLWSKSNELL